MLGYSPEIIQRAQAAVDKFLQDGEWVKSKEKQDLKYKLNLI